MGKAMPAGTRGDMGSLSRRRFDDTNRWLNCLGDTPLTFDNRDFKAEMLTVYPQEVVRQAVRTSGNTARCCSRSVGFRGTGSNKTRT